MKYRNITIAILLLIMCFAFCGCADNKKSGKERDSEVESESIEATPTSDNTKVLEETKATSLVPDKYAYSLVVTINPEVELYFDEKDIIIGLDYLNKDAEDAYKNVSIVGKSLDEGMPVIIDSAVDKGYLSKDGQVSVELAKVSDKEAVKDSKMLGEAEVVIQNHTATKFNEPVKTNVKVNDNVTKDTGITAKKMCDTCKGKGVYCSECAGTTIVNCKRCVGGVESCGTCHGTAVITCHGCHGNNSAGCSYCGGTGKMSCDACNGQGTFSCSWCKGALKHICPICEGTPGTCKDCNGSGYVN